MQDSTHRSSVHTHKDGSTHTRPIPRHGCTSQLNKSMMSFLFSSSMVSGRVLMYELSRGFHPSYPAAQHSTPEHSKGRMKQDNLVDAHSYVPNEQQSCFIATYAAII